MAEVDFNRVNWQNDSTGGTPLGAANLNVMDKGIADCAEQINTNTASIETINTKLSDSGWLTLTTNVYYRKKNGIVFVFFTGFALTNSQDNAVGTLPDGYTPSIAIVASLAATLDSYVRIYCKISTAGTILVSSSSSSAYAYGMVAFPL
jgi:hypothetical protein